MSASLVGSEMCIRDRLCLVAEGPCWRSLRSSGGARSALPSRCWLPPSVPGRPRRTRSRLARGPLPTAW
eukprot:11234525-Alexandrium_andersonii.AAC.1